MKKYIACSVARPTRAEDKMGASEKRLGELMVMGLGTVIAKTLHI